MLESALVNEAKKIADTTEATKVSQPPEMRQFTETSYQDIQEEGKLVEQEDKDYLREQCSFGDREAERIRAASEQKNTEEAKEKKETVIENNDATEQVDSTNETKEGLTDEQRELIKAETNWNDSIIDAIGSWDEYKIYKEAALQQTEINGKPCLARTDIDWNRKDEMGRTNTERAQQGLSPINNDGKTIELHHIGQHSESPFAELTQEEHRGSGNDNILHHKSKDTEIDRSAFNSERINHWKSVSSMSQE